MDSRAQRHMWAEFVLVLDPAPGGFSPGNLVFHPQQKPTRSLFELAVDCAPRSCMDCTVAARRCLYNYAFGPTLLSCVLAVLARAISETVIIIIIIIILLLLSP